MFLGKSGFGAGARGHGVSDAVGDARKSGRRSLGGANHYISGIVRGVTALTVKEGPRTLCLTSAP